MGRKRKKSEIYQNFEIYLSIRVISTAPSLARESGGKKVSYSNFPKTPKPISLGASEWVQSPPVSLLITKPLMLSSESED